MSNVTKLHTNIQAGLIDYTARASDEDHIKKPESLKGPFAFSAQKSVAILLITVVVALISTGVAPLERIASAYPISILIIYVALDLFARLVINTGAVEELSINTARASRGSLIGIVIGISFLTFILSSIVNNLAAIFVIAPFVLHIASVARLPRQVIHGMFVIMVVMSNLGGASSPIGDFPAIQIQTAGLAGFLEYLLAAFPLFAVNATLFALTLAIIISGVETQSDQGMSQGAAIFSIELAARMSEHRKVDWRSLIILGVIFSLMLATWALAPSDAVPFAATAVGGTVLAFLFAKPSHVQGALDDARVDALLVMAGVLGIAAIASATGWLDNVVLQMTESIENPLLLLYAIMIVAALASACVSAGPAAAATIPLILSLQQNALSDHRTLVAVGFAVAICAGSSCFMWSATAGPALAQIARQFKANRKSDGTDSQSWGVKDYLPIGPILALCQLTFGFIWIGCWYAFSSGAWMPATACLMSALIGVVSGWKARTKLQQRSLGLSQGWVIHLASWASILSLAIGLYSLSAIVLNVR